MEKYWYVISTNERSERDNRQYIGTSPLTPEEFRRAMAAREPIVISNLTHVSIGGETKSYSDEWEPHPNTVFLNPSHIISVVPLKADWQQYQQSWDNSLLKRVEGFFDTLKGEG
jgi:hypothetical protein